MDSQEEALDKQDTKSNKSRRKDSPSYKKPSGFAKLASKVTRKRSLKKEKQEKKDTFYEPVFSSTEDSGNSISDQPISPADSVLSSYSPPPMSGPTLVPLSKSTSKSEDSLDSGIYSRQKSCDSVDSLGSTGSSGNGTDHTIAVMSYVTAGETVQASDEYGHHRHVNAGKYDDYWREYRDIRQSIIVQDDDFDKRSVTRTDSGGDEEEDEGEWLRQAGLSDLVSSGSLSLRTQSGNAAAASTTARLSTDSITSMTILSTLTRPQREAVLRRITSFNRAQKSRRRPKPHISAVFPQNFGEGKNDSEGVAGKPPLAPPTVEVTSPINNDNTSKSTSLPHNISGFGDHYQRRYSEVTRRPATSAMNLTESDGMFSSSLSTAFSTPSLDTGHVVKLDQKGYQRKEALNSIVATEPSAQSSHDHVTTLPSPTSSHNIPVSLSRTPAFCFRKRSKSFPSHCVTLPSIDQKSNLRDVIPELNCSHFTFPPRLKSIENNAVLNTNSSDVLTSSMLTSKPPHASRIIKSFLHGSETSLHSVSESNSSVSEQFTSDLSPHNESKIEPFEFSPIMLTTSMTSIRKTRVIRSMPSSPNIPIGHGLRHRSDLTTSVFSRPSIPITSILPNTDSLVAESKNNSRTEISRLSITENTDSEPVVPTSSSKDENLVSKNSPSSPELKRAASSSFISFTSSLNHPFTQSLHAPHKSSSWHTLPLSYRPHKRRSSLRARRTKSTNLSPRHKSAKSFQTLLPKVSSFSISNLATSPTHLGSHKLLRLSPKSRKLKRASSLYGELVHAHHSTLESDSNRK